MNNCYYYQFYHVIQSLSFEETIYLMDKQEFFDLFSIPSFLLQKETPHDIQLHLASIRGDVTTLRKLLDSGRVHVDCKDEVS